MNSKKNLLLLTLTIITLSACQNKPPQVGTPISSGEDVLSYKVAKDYVKNYGKHAGFVDSVYDTTGENKTKKNPNTRAVWFGIDRLKAIVDSIKAEGGDGIRFYLASYDSTYKATFVGGHKPPRKYWGYNTLIMVSTKDSLKQYHQDYYNTTPVANQTNRGHIITVVPENRGEMCPPPHNCKIIGATLIP